MPADFRKKLDAELTNGLQELAARQQLRALNEVRGVNLCSNDYLALAEHPALQAAALESVAAADRMGSTGSRLLSGHAQIWTDLEKEFAQFAGTDAALFFGSGYAANVGLLTSLLGRDDLVFSDALNHASLIDGIRLSGASKFIYPHLDLQTLEQQLREASGLHGPGRKLIVTETVFGMDGDIAPVRELLDLAERYDAGLILDEAHATGVHGPAGRGLAAQEGIAHQAVAMVHTCGKALGSAGAFVCGSSVLQSHLVNSARTFLFSTALPPYLAGQICAALRLAAEMDEQRQSLLENARWLRQVMRDAGWNTAASTSQIIPVILGDNEAALDLAEFLQSSGFAARAIRPPTVPAGTSRIRISLTAAIPRQQLERLVSTMQLWRARSKAATAMSHA